MITAGMGWMERAVDLLTRDGTPSIDISVGVLSEDQHYLVYSEHTLPGGELRSFFTKWADGELAKPEYAWGISLIHDAKDHYLWGMPISQMAEFQAICQIELGRALLIGGAEWLSFATENIIREIGLELYATERPRVYTPSVRGVLANLEEGGDHSALETAIQAFCFKIAVPEILDLYTRLPDLLNLQRSVRENPLIGCALLPGIHWYDTEEQTLRLSDNVGFRTTRRASVNSDCLATSQRIRRAWYLWLDHNDVDADWVRYPLFEDEHR